MKKYILYTTSKGSWIKDEVVAFCKAISKTKGRGTVELGDVVFKKPNTVKVVRDDDGDIKPSWEWFRSTYPKGDHDGVIVHMTDYYKRKWGITNTINGSRNPDNTDYPEFWICAERNEKADGYKDLTEASRLLFHEHGHFDEDVDDAYSNILTQDSVHKTDYYLKQIDKYHLLVDYRGKFLKEKVNELINQVFKLAKKII